MIWKPNFIYKSIKNLIIKRRRCAITIAVLLQAALSNYLAFLIRFDGVLGRTELQQFASALPVLLLVRLIFFLRSGLNRTLWRYASIDDLIKTMKTSVLGSISFMLIIRHLIGNSTYPRSVYLLDMLLFILLLGGSRMFMRIFKEYMKDEVTAKKVLLVGAGDAGEFIAREMNNNSRYRYSPVGFIDDDPYKKGLTIHGIPIMGASSAIPEIITKYKPDEVIISMPSANPGSIKKIYDYCKPFNLPVKKLPRLSDILSGNISVSEKLGQMLIDAKLVTDNQVNEALAMQKKDGGRLGSKLIKLGYITEESLVSFLNKQFRVSQIKPISLEDLLQREPVRTDIKSVREFIQGKTVLVTGAGGSIGSELSRQILKYGPELLLILDRYENSLFFLDRELGDRVSRNEHKTRVISIIGDIQDHQYMDHLFAKHAPHIVFHAAAYKHVPLMEFNPIEAVKNNIFGTKNLLDTASKYRAQSFVSISTDKAVNPTSIMGATKRIAEFLTINMNGASSTRCSAVRFGNVLGTNGSVVPIFKEQLMKGGPITVTHPEVKRFFMLIPEAMQLVLIAAAAGKGGEIFVLDMGEQVKIVDLAENLIRLSGFIPYKEIKIDFTGLRPGEKLYEELFDHREQVMSTFHDKLKIAVSEVPSVLNHHLEQLRAGIQKLSVNDVIAGIQRIVPGFREYPGQTGELIDFDPILRKENQKTA